MTTNESQDNFKESIAKIKLDLCMVLDFMATIGPQATLQKERKYTVKEVVGLLKSYCIEYSTESLALKTLWLEDEINLDNGTLVSCAVALLESVLNECKAMQKDETYNPSALLFRDTGEILRSLSQLVVIKTDEHG